MCWTRSEKIKIRNMVVTLRNVASSTSLNWKMKHFYESCMNLDNIETDEGKPLKKIISTGLGTFCSSTARVVRTCSKCVFFFSPHCSFKAAGTCWEISTSTRGIWLRRLWRCTRSTAWARSSRSTLCRTTKLPERTLSRYAFVAKCTSTALRITRNIDLFSVDYYSFTY